jgi:peroxiredoxin Q/BCP
MTKVAVGDAAPDFKLPGTAGSGSDAGRRDYTLSEWRGRPVVLVFYPGDNTPVCTRQLNAYTADIAEFESLDAQILAISPQSVESHDEFAGAQGGFGFPLLADEDKEVGKRYGILGPIGFYRRSVFVVDGEGDLRYVHRGVAGLSFRTTAELVAAVRDAG